ncbi:MAG: hypothetical protein ACLSDQ_08630 [Adlercreutzia equolifaciens]
MYPREAGQATSSSTRSSAAWCPEYIPSIDKGIQEALNSGVLAGYPVEDVKVELIDGSYHDVDSSEAAFKVAGSMAIKDALRKSNPVILEPVMAVEVETPEEYTGFVMGDIPSRRGLIQGQEQRGSAVVIEAKVPLGNMFGYATDLRSGTQGRAVYTCSSTPTSRCPSPCRTRLSARPAATPKAPSEKLLFGGNVSGKSEDSHPSQGIRS